MKLLDLSISGFGKFHSRTVSFEDGLNIVYGKNEAGKSTLHTFIRGMLFGLERQRGRAARKDLYTLYKPWENGETYEGRLRLEQKGNIYRIERNFQRGAKEFSIVDETLGKKIEPTRAFLEDLLCGLTETSYNNTVSIGQLKSATDEGMVTELKNYIANLNTSGSIALNITKATDFLRKQRRGLEAQMMPEAARTYTSLLSEIRNMEKEISSPEYENQIHTYQTLRSEAKDIVEKKQQEKEVLLQKVARGRQVLAGGDFTDQASIASCLLRTQGIYEDYQTSEKACAKKRRKILCALSAVAATVLLLGAGYFYSVDGSNPLTISYGIGPSLLCAGSGVLSVFLYAAALLFWLKDKRLHKTFEANAKLLQEVFSKHLGDSSISPEAMSAFEARMAEFTRLNTAIAKSEETIEQQEKEINDLKQRQDTCTEVIEKQQRIQWELEKKLEHLANCKTQAEGLKHILTENDRIREELAAIDLAQETMTSLSTSIRDSFGLYLNKTASELITSITGGIYTSMSVDENLNVFLNTKTRLVPIEQVSRGTVDQVYLALRLAAAQLIQGGKDQNQSRDLMPLVLDDSFALYDDDRLKTALKWLAQSYGGQIIMFTCHQREAQMLTANLIPYHLIEI